MLLDLTKDNWVLKAELRLHQDEKVFSSEKCGSAPVGPDPWMCMEGENIA